MIILYNNFPESSSLSWSDQVGVEDDFLPPPDPDNFKQPPTPVGNPLLAPQGGALSARAARSAQPFGALPCGQYKRRGARQAAPLRALSTGARERSRSTPTLSTSYPGYTSPWQLPGLCCPQLMNPPRGLLPLLTTGIMEHK